MQTAQSDNRFVDGFVKAEIPFGSMKHKLWSRPVSEGTNMGGKSL